MQTWLAPSNNFCLRKILNKGTVLSVFHSCHLSGLEPRGRHQHILIWKREFPSSADLCSGKRHRAGHWPLPPHHLQTVITVSINTQQKACNHAELRQAQLTLVLLPHLGEPSPGAAGRWGQARRGQGAFPRQPRSCCRGGARRWRPRVAAAPRSRVTAAPQPLQSCPRRSDPAGRGRRPSANPSRQPRPTGTTLPVVPCAAAAPCSQEAARRRALPLVGFEKKPRPLRRVSPGAAGWVSGAGPCGHRALAGRGVAVVVGPWSGVGGLCGGGGGAEAASPGSSRCHAGYAGGSVGCEQFEMGPPGPR